MIRKIREGDRPVYLEMARDFYSSPAVCHSVPEAYFLNAFREMMESDRYLAGYLFEYEGKAAGYALLVKNFSQEAGGMVLWLDEFYVLPEYRGRGLGHEFFGYLKNNLSDGTKRVRLEVTAVNKRAISLYRRMGFQELPYLQMVIDLQNPPDRF